MIVSVESNGDTVDLDTQDTVILSISTDGGDEVYFRIDDLEDGLKLEVDSALENRVVMRGGSLVDGGY